MQKNQKQGIAQLDGKIIIPLEYDNIIIAGNCINAEKSGNVTLFRTDGTEFQNKEFVSRIPTGNDKYIICVNKEDKYGVIDDKDNKVISIDNIAEESEKEARKINSSVREMTSDIRVVADEDDLD